MIVESNIIREGTDTLKINLKWRLLNKDNQIKIIDLNIEGISLVIAQREEFQSFLANNDYNLDKLIEKIVSVSDHFEIPMCIQHYKEDGFTSMLGSWSPPY